MSIIEDLKLQYRMGDITTRLIFINILFFLPNVVIAVLSLFRIDTNFFDYVSLSSDPSDLLWKPWSIISYAFFHANVLHIIFNLLMLNFAGRIFNTFFTQKQLLGLYIAGAFVAGSIYILSYMFLPMLAELDVTMVGASGSIMAILFATMTYSPHMPVRLFLFGNVKLWHVVMVLVIIDLIQLPLGNTGGHIAHLAGAFFGYIFIKQLQSGRDLVSWIANGIESLSGRFSGKRSKRPFKVHKNYIKPSPKPEPKVVTKNRTQQQIDEILDKISRSGYDSLSKEEKDFLFRAGKQ